jgi:hypothetical protein
MTTPVQTLGGYIALRDYLLALPREQYSVELAFADIHRMTGQPIDADDVQEAAWTSNPNAQHGPLRLALDQAGFGVAFIAGRTATDGYVGFGRGLHRWPGVWVLSDQFGRLPFADRLRQLAYGYLESGKVLCVDLGERAGALTWPRASVVCLCSRHATELFYKSCILYRGMIVDCNHDIGILREQFRSLFPEPEFDVKTFHDMAVQKNEDQVFRYFGDRSGQLPMGSYGFSPATWLGILECLEMTMDRVYAQIDLVPR